MFVLLITSMFSESFIETTSSLSLISRSSRIGYPLAPVASRFDSLFYILLFRLFKFPDSICSRFMCDVMILLNTFCRFCSCIWATWLEDVFRMPSVLKLRFDSCWRRKLGSDAIMFSSWLVLLDSSSSLLSSSLDDTPKLTALERGLAPRTWRVFLFWPVVLTL